MSVADDAVDRSRSLPTILVAAVIQGWALYGLHTAIMGNHWPATEPAWLLACYAITAFIPLTVQMLAGAIRDKATWIAVAALTATFFYFGWHHGAHVIDMQEANQDLVEQWFPLGFVLVVLWLMMLPFIQVRIRAGGWRAPYATLFATAWNNHLLLAEAAAFTALFWLLLLLWQQLFAMIGIVFFRELFQEPVFIYPVTSITFGIALHLIGSLDRLTRVVLEQVLNVLKWLVILVGIILALFTVALVAKLPGMIASGERAIGAAWLLWLIAVTVLLINAAYRDGSVEWPYPRPIAMAVRCVVPLTIIIAFTALYALYLRIDRYGLTVERVWACIVASAAVVYSVGYAFAASDKRWMSGIARVNVGAALFLIAVLLLSLTPILSPYRISAASQFARVVKEWPLTADRSADHPLLYLRFFAGDYGLDRLRQLAKLSNHPQAQAIRKDVEDVLARKNRRTPTPLVSDIDMVLSKMEVWPKGRVAEAALIHAVKAELSKPDQQHLHSRARDVPLLGLFIDLDDDGSEEFLLLTMPKSTIFQSDTNVWRAAGLLTMPYQLQGESLRQALDENQVQVSEPRWKMLNIGGKQFQQVER